MSGSIEEALEVPRWSIDLMIRGILDAVLTSGIHELLLITMYKGNHEH